MNSYLKILSQKNAYLKEAMITGKADIDYLDVLNLQLAKSAAVLIKQRSGFADLLKTYACDIYSRISGEKEGLNVKYVSSTKRDFSDAEATEKRLFDIYRAERETELKNGRTFYGPHRDDLMIYISNHISDREIDSAEENSVSELAARTFGSQGQQRSAVLSIKLAEGEIFNSITGEYPVFLLDDLLGELDSDRRKMFTELIKDKQAIITCCDKDAMPDMKNISAVQVVGGRYIK